MNRVKNRTERKTAVKLRVIFVLFVVIAALIVGRLANYQLKMYDYYQTKVLNQLTIQTEVTPERGTITDRNGNILAANKTVYNVILSPADIITMMKSNEKKNSDSDPENDVFYNFSDPDYGINYAGNDLSELIAEALSKYLDVDKQFILEKEAKVKRMYEVIKNNVEAELAEKIEEFIAAMESVSTDLNLIITTFLRELQVNTFLRRMRERTICLSNTKDISKPKMDIISLPLSIYISSTSLKTSSRKHSSNRLPETALPVLLWT